MCFQTQRLDQNCVGYGHYHGHQNQSLVQQGLLSPSNHDALSDVQTPAITPGLVFDVTRVDPKTGIERKLT